MVQNKDKFITTGEKQEELSFNRDLNMGVSTKVGDSENQKSKATLLKSEPFLRNLLNEIISRVKFKYTSKDIIHAFFSCFRFRSTNSRRFNQAYRKYYLFQKAQKKLAKDFDTLNLLKMMKQLKLLTTVLLHPH